MGKNISFLGINLSVYNREEIVEKICEFALVGRQKMITYINADCVNIAFKDKNYKNILNQMDIIRAGGMGVVWGARFLGEFIPCRINLQDFFDRLLDKAVEKNITFYFLGGKPNVVQKVKKNLENKYPQLKIIGVHHGYFNKNAEYNVIKEINILKPNILMVGMGVPKQEKWICEHLNELEVNLSIAVGGAFNNLSGRFKTTPSWISDIGLEWLCRLFQEPKRLWKRYLVGNFIFVYQVLRCKLKGSCWRR